MPDYEREWDESAKNLEQLVRLTIGAQPDSRAHKQRAFLVQARLGVIQTEQTSQLADATEALADVTRGSEEHSQRLVAATEGLKKTTVALVVVAALQTAVLIFTAVQSYLAASPPG